MKEKILVVVLPIFLFIAKQFLPIYAKYTSSEEDEKPDYSVMFKAVFDEVVLFPVDIVFIAISWLVPKVFVNDLDELTRVQAEVQRLQEQLVHITEDMNSRDVIADELGKEIVLQNKLLLHIITGTIISCILFICLFFFVLQTKKVQKSLGWKRWVPTMFLYILSWFALFFCLNFRRFAYEEPQTHYSSNAVLLYYFFICTNCSVPNGN